MKEGKGKGGKEKGREDGGEEKRIGGENRFCSSKNSFKNPATNCRF